MHLLDVPFFETVFLTITFFFTYRFDGTNPPNHITAKLPLLLALLNGCLLLLVADIIEKLGVIEVVNPIGSKHP